MASICVVGDIMLDFVTSLGSSDMNELLELKNVPGTIKVLPGGTGFVFTKAVLEEGFERICLIGKLGADQKDSARADVMGQYILNELKDMGVDVAITLDYVNSTGITMITYLPNGNRLLVSHGGANNSYCLADINEDVEEKVAESDILFVSGYSLLKQERAQAVQRLMEKAKECRRTVILDVVPHSIYRLMDDDTFRKLTDKVDIIVSETGTIQRLFPQLNLTLEESDTLVDTMAAFLLRNYSAVILQPDSSQLYFKDKHGLIEVVPTSAENLLPEHTRGYVDRLIARLLHTHFTRFSSN